MTYRPMKQTQIDGSPFAQKNCICALTTMLIDRVTVGRLRVPPARIRAISGDTSEGLSLSQAADAAVNATHGDVILTPMYGLARAQVKTLVDSGRAVGVVINCAVTRFTTRRTNAFTGMHGIFANRYYWWPGGEKCECELRTTNQHGEYDCEDPGTTKAGYLRWSADLLYRAAEAADGGPISLLAGRDTENVTRTARDKANLRAKPLVSSKDVGNIKPGQASYVSETVNGGAWKRADKTMATGWHHVPGGFAKGEAFR